MSLIPTPPEQALPSPLSLSPPPNVTYTHPPRTSTPLPPKRSPPPQCHLPPPLYIKVEPSCNWPSLFLINKGFNVVGIQFIFSFKVLSSIILKLPTSIKFQLGESWFKIRVILLTIKLLIYFVHNTQWLNKRIRINTAQWNWWKVHQRPWSVNCFQTILQNAFHWKLKIVMLLWWISLSSWSLDVPE